MKKVFSFLNCFKKKKQAADSTQTESIRLKNTNIKKEDDQDNDNEEEEEENDDDDDELEKNSIEKSTAIWIRGANRIRSQVFKMIFQDFNLF
jgi:hypothetical protein